MEGWGWGGLVGVAVGPEGVEGDAAGAAGDEVGEDGGGAWGELEALATMSGGDRAGWGS